MKADERDFCLVDQCVLTDDVRVGFLYREDPEPGDPHGDSGWSIRGDAVGATDAEIDARGIAYVSLATVLEKDASWRHLIDSLPGTAFVRNPVTGTFETVDPDTD